MPRRLAVDASSHHAPHANSCPTSPSYTYNVRASSEQPMSKNSNRRIPAQTSMSDMHPPPPPPPHSYSSIHGHSSLSPPSPDDKASLSFLLNPTHPPVAKRTRTRSSNHHSQPYSEPLAPPSAPSGHPYHSVVPEQPVRQFVNSSHSYQPSYEHATDSQQPSSSSLRPPPSPPLPPSSTAVDGGAPRIKKPRERTFICDTCSFGFFTRSDLQKHQSSVHLGLKPYGCPSCPRMFGERSNASKQYVDYLLNR
jgi:hypothetical protein